MLKRTFYIVIFLILIISNAEADETFPYSYSVYNSYEGGRLIISNNEKNPNSIFSYFIKPNWTGETDILTVWKGLKSDTIIGSSLQNVNIISVYSNKKSIFLIWKEKDKLFLSAIDSTANIINKKELKGNWLGIDMFNTHWEKACDDNSFLILINNSLYHFSYKNNSFPTVKFIADKVNAALAFKKLDKIIYTVNSEGWINVTSLDKNWNESIIARLRLSNIIYLKKLQNKIGIISTDVLSKTSWLHIIDFDKGVISKQSIDANGRFIKVRETNKQIYFYYLTYGNRKYYIKYFKYMQDKFSEIINEIAIPDGFLKPLKFCMKKKGYIFFQNGLVSFSNKGSIVSSDYFPLGEYFNGKLFLSVYKQFIILSSPTYSIIFKETDNKFWYIFRFAQTTGKFIIPLILLIVIIWLIRKYRIQRRMLKAVIDIPSSGIVYFVDKKGRLINANDSGKKILGITKKVPLKRLFGFYCDIDNTKSLKELVEESINLRENFTRRINIIIGNKVQEWFFSIVALRKITGKLTGYVLTGVDITEELERQRLSNWAQLAHDMQTNLSTIRLNAEQLEYNKDNSNLLRKTKIIHQATLLIQKVRDIITVGRSNVLDLQYVNAVDICLEVRNEFDETMFPNIAFELDTSEFQLECDKTKIIRALRNAVENSIRALLGDKGIITIACSQDIRYSYFIIKDSGSGMDEEKMERMMTPYFTTSKKDGGSGIGTMIMQNVIEQHGGKLIINSEPGKGTEIQFCLPKFERKSSKDEKNG